MPRLGWTISVRWGETEDEERPWPAAGVRLSWLVCVGKCAGGNKHSRSQIQRLALNRYTPIHAFAAVARPATPTVDT